MARGKYRKLAAGLNTAFNKARFNYLSRKFVTKAIHSSIDLREQIKKPLHSKFLDFGCGVGWMSILAAKDGFDVYSFDIDRSRILYKKSIKDRLNIKLAVADGESLPYKDKAFDVIYCCHVLEHIPNDHKALSEAYRVLRDDGIFIISVPNVYNLSTRFKMKLHYKNPFIDSAHLREYDRDELITLLYNYGFRILAIKTTGFLLPFGNLIFNFVVIQFNLQKATTLLGRKFPRSGVSIDIVMNKRMSKYKGSQDWEKVLPLPLSA